MLMILQTVSVLHVISILVADSNVYLLEDTGSLYGKMNTIIRQKRLDNQNISVSYSFPEMDCDFAERS